MSLEFLWFLPTGGDGPYLGSNVGHRPPSNRYMREIAQAADRLGYHGVLLPTGTSCEDAWTTATSIVTHTEHLRFLIALRPGVILPAIAAQQAATFDRLSGGRLSLNIVAGGRHVELAGEGIFLDHDARYAEADEFLRIWRGLMRGERVDFTGRHLSVREGRLMFPPVQAPYPPLYFGGSSAPARAIAAEHVDVYLTWGEPPQRVAEKIADVRRRAAELGRTVRFGIRLHFIVRETAQAAWDAAASLISHLSDDVIAIAQRNMTRHSDSEGQRRMVELHGGRRDQLEVSPNLWAGVGLVRDGAGTALVGDPQTVAQRLREYAALGVDTVIGSGYPHLEEAYRVAELLFAHLDLAPNAAQAQAAPAPKLFTGGSGGLSVEAFPLPSRAPAR